MLLKNLEIIGHNKKQCIQLRDGYIKEIAGQIDSPDELVLKFEDVIAFPGLINSHDHLDFNSFPRLGNRKYANYVEWGNDIHDQDKEQIRKVLNIPQELRIRWGVYKNLLNGITTVVNHGPKLHVDEDLISIFQDCHSIHSIRLEKRWWLRLNKPRKGRLPFVSHVGEGTDPASHNEIDRLLKWNVTGQELIGVHGVAMSERQAAKFAALVWSPDTNFFLLGKTAPIDKLKENCPVIFGTDSTLTGSWNLFEQLRIAKNTGMASGEELYKMVTATPASVWKMHDRGKLVKGMRADLVIARKPGSDALNDFHKLNPEDILLVVHHGNIMLFDDSLKPQLILSHYPTVDFFSIGINGSRKFVKGDLPGLMNQISQHYPDVSFPVSIS
jgi:cytosine/adenosine deaminase-related metal-dependent hydrolase